jgi:hypothetical protein
VDALILSGRKRSQKEEEGAGIGVVFRDFVFLFAVKAVL